MHQFPAQLWRYEGEAAWWFVTVPGDVSDDLRALTEGTRRGFGSVRVQVRIGGTQWRTSVFPDSKRGVYLLPVKREVRRAERLDEGAPVHVVLEVLER